MPIKRYITPKTRVEEFFSLLFSNHMNAYPKKTPSPYKKRLYDDERQWVFIGSKEKMKSMATQSTLFAAVGDPEFNSTYYTPNGYYRRDQRLTESLRWLNGYVFDLDISGDTVLDIMDRLHDAGLPSPTAIVKTPSGGHHVSYFFKESVRATPKAISLYTAIMRHIAVDIKSDLSAVGANRIFRTPSESNLVYFNHENLYEFDVFKNWREINHPFTSTKSGEFSIYTGNIMSHPALQYLLEAPCSEGNRDKTAFTLSLAMKASKWSQAEAENAIRVWYATSVHRASAPGKDPFTERDAIYKVEYVYRNSSLNLPSAQMIRELSGMNFYYQNRVTWVSAKPRNERERVHLTEWKEDLLALLESEKELIGTQEELAKRINCPLASFKEVIRSLKESEEIIVETRRGRGGNTTIRLPEQLENHLTTSKGFLLPKNKTKETVINRSGNVIYVNFKKNKHIIGTSFYEPDPDGPD